MLDLNDTQQLHLYDRRGLMDRATDHTARWRQALAVAPLEPQPVDVIWLDFPPEKRGVARLVQDYCLLETPTAMPKVLVWQEGFADLPLTSRTIKARSLPPHLQDELAHPADLFLGILALLDLSPPLTNLPDLEQLLHAFQPSIPIADNPAKALAQSLSERLPVFWAVTSLLGLAQVWQQRFTRYAERHAQWMDGDTLRSSQVMARFPGYWPQAGSLVHLRQPAQKDDPAAPQLARLLHSRRIHTVTLTPERALTPAQTILYFVELAEWTALYSAALIGVNPADRVALDFLTLD